MYVKLDLAIYAFPQLATLKHEKFQQNPDFPAGKNAIWKKNVFSSALLFSKIRHSQIKAKSESFTIARKQLIELTGNEKICGINAQFLYKFACPAKASKNRSIFWPVLF